MQCSVYLFQPDCWAVVVAQLAERLLPISEDLGSNAFIRNFYIKHLFNLNCIEKRGLEWSNF